MQVCIKICDKKEVKWREKREGKLFEKAEDNKIEINVRERERN